MCYVKWFVYIYTCFIRTMWKKATVSLFCVFAFCITCCFNGDHHTTQCHFLCSEGRFPASQGLPSGHDLGDSGGLPASAWHWLAGPHLQSPRGSGQRPISWEPIPTSWFCLTAVIAKAAGSLVCGRCYFLVVVVWQRYVQRGTLPCDTSGIACRGRLRNMKIIRPLIPTVGDSVSK